MVIRANGGVMVKKAPLVGRVLRDRRDIQGPREIVKKSVSPIITAYKKSIIQ